MRTLGACLALGCLGAVLADSGQEFCDDAYECKFYYETSTDLLTYDLSPLCSSVGYAFRDTVNTVLNDTYNFNICGYSPKYCMPQGSSQIYTAGVAVQSWGTPPACNANTFNCTDPVSLENVCCTEDCEVLGIDPPEFRIKDKKNPQTGGLIVQHRGMPRQPGVLNPCPPTNNFGVQYGRNVTFHIECDPSVNLEFVDGEESPTCSYQLYLKSKHACGDAYSGPGSASSRNGLVAGMFFLGLFIGILALGGYWWYTAKYGGCGKSGSYFKFGSGSSAPSGTAPSAYGGSTKGSSMGSSSYSTVG